jgi:hypothetical protein
MAQHDYNIANQSGQAFRADLNNALAAIVSGNSGASAPSTTYAYQYWVDTSTGPATLKQRNSSNNAWITIGQLDTANLQAGLASIVNADVNANAAIVASKLSFTQAGTGATARTVDSKLKDVVSVKDFGAVGNGVTNDTVAIQAAIVSLRANATSILDTIGGSTITVYSSGTVEFDRGVYLISPDTLRIYQDLGLTLRGKGSRRTNNAIRAATTILVSGTSSGYGIQAYRSGGRGLTIEDMDICYASAAFTGDVLDIVDCPGVTLRRVFLGTYGLTGGTRLQTARSCIRSTYDEFLHAVDCVFDGAIDGWWSDDIRTELGNTFGGSVTKFDSCVWYDFTQRMIRHDGNRTRTAVSLSSCVFNPISVNCVRCVDLNNIDGLHMSGSKCAGSVANYATTEWMRLINVTGALNGNVFSSLTKSGTVSGMLGIEGNVFAGTDGLTVTGGVVSGKSNEFRTGTNAWTISPTIDLCVDIGPDIILSSVTKSYDVPADSALLAGRVNYDATSDQSSSKFSNASMRISIDNVDRKSFTVSSSPYSTVITDTGRRILASSGSAQTINLPVPVPGTTLHISKVNNQALTINCPGGVNFYSGVTGVDTSAAASGSDIGSGLSLSAYATIGWIVTSAVGTWTFT